MTHRPCSFRRRLLIAGSLLPVAVAVAGPACEVTPWQTKGPFFPESVAGESDQDLTRVAGRATRADGKVIVVHGRVLDGDCRPIAGAMIDLWQANALGRYAHSADRNPAPLDPNFQGSARFATDAEGRYRVRTIKPGAYALEYLDGAPRETAGFRTPHLHFRVMKRGYQELATQMYFPGEALNEADRVLARAAAGQRERLIPAACAQARDDPDEAPRFEFDLTLESS
jgi:protocatechuate 3,4-dioxygenase, beta subunit